MLILLECSLYKMGDDLKNLPEIDYDNPNVKKWIVQSFSNFICMAHFTYCPSLAGNAKLLHIFPTGLQQTRNKVPENLFSGTLCKRVTRLACQLGLNF